MAAIDGHSDYGGQGRIRRTCEVFPWHFAIATVHNRVLVVRRCCVVVYYSL
jgi:hypothetical protein